MFTTNSSHLVNDDLKFDDDAATSIEPARQRWGIQAIRTAKVLDFADLGMEAIYEFDVVDMPVTVAVDAAGTSALNTGLAELQKRIATGEFEGIAVSAG